MYDFIVLLQKGLSVTCDKSVIFSGYSGFIHLLVVFGTRIHKLYSKFYR